jgi:hypothetical protein
MRFQSGGAVGDARARRVAVARALAVAGTRGVQWLQGTSNNFSPEAARCVWRWHVVFLSRLKPLLQPRAAPL